MKSKNIIVRENPTCPESIRSTIAQISNEIKKFLSGIDGFGYDKFRDIMKSLSPKWKFVEKRSSGAGANFYYVSKKFGIVVKLPYVTTGEHDTVYAKIYTEVIDVVDYFYIFIQPLATTSKKISEKVLDLLYKKPNGSLDLHDGNVGIFRNQAVVFDW